MFNGHSIVRPEKLVLLVTSIYVALPAQRLAYSEIHSEFA
jgi:hypothetical protein